MEGIYKVETYSLRTLSPLHIGTGIKLGNWDFLDKNGKVYIISLDKLIENLTEIQQEKLVNYMESRRSLKEFIKNENINVNIPNISSYEIFLIDFSESIRNIWEEIKHPEGIYLPASTIKGAIRTAILYSLLKENHDKYTFDIKEFKIKDGKKYKDIVLTVNGKEIEGVDNIEKFLNQEFFGEKQSDDIFKFFKISDSKLIRGFENLVCRKIYVANTTRFDNGKFKKHPEYYETIEEDANFHNIEISILISKEHERFINSKYLKTLEKLRNWKQTVYEFSNDLIEAEISFWKNEDVKNMIEQAYRNSPYKDLLNSFNKEEVINQLEEINKLNSPENPVIRLGKLTGYFTHSIGLLLAKDKERPYDIHEFGKLFFKNRAKDWLFPLTRRLTLDNQTLGWCQFYLQTENKEQKSQKALVQENKKDKNEANKTIESIAEKLANSWGGRFRK